MKKRGSGFTLVEIMITVTIIGILSATVALSISRYVLERKSEEKVVAFHALLQQMRGYAFRDNARYDIVLNLGVPTGNILKKVDTEEAVAPLFPELNSIVNALKFNTPSTPLSVAPSTNAWLTDNITFNNDDIGTINSGIIYLQNASADNIFYAIVRPENENVIKLFKWNGTAWSEL